MKIGKYNPMKNKFLFVNTTINHVVRNILHITYNEYIMLDWLERMEKKEPTLVIKQFMITAGLGYSDVTTKRLLLHLHSRGLIEKKKVGQKDFNLVPSQRWYDMFKTENDFEKFWNYKDKEGKQIHMGNKQKALAMYGKIRKKVTYDYIISQFLAYRKFCKKQGVFQMHTSSWLSPQYEHYKTDYEKQYNETQIENKTNGRQKTKIESEIDDW